MPITLKAVKAIHQRFTAKAVSLVAAGNAALHELSYLEALPDGRVREAASVPRDVLVEMLLDPREASHLRQTIRAVLSSAAAAGLFRKVYGFTPNAVIRIAMSDLAQMHSALTLMELGESVMGGDAHGTGEHLAQAARAAFTHAVMISIYVAGGEINTVTMIDASTGATELIGFDEARVAAVLGEVHEPLVSSHAAGDADDAEGEGGGADFGSLSRLPALH